MGLVLKRGADLVGWAAAAAGHEYDANNSWMEQSGMCEVLPLGHNMPHYSVKAKIKT